MGAHPINLRCLSGMGEKGTNSLQQAEYTLQIDSAALASLDINTVKNLFFFIGNNSDTIDAVDFTLELTFGETSVKKISLHSMCFLRY